MILANSPFFENWFRATVSRYVTMSVSLAPFFASLFFKTSFCTHNSKNPNTHIPLVVLTTKPVILMATTVVQVKDENLVRLTPFFVLSYFFYSQLLVKEFAR